MRIYILPKLVVQTPRHSNHGDMLKNNHISLTIVVNKAFELGPGSEQAELLLPQILHVSIDFLLFSVVSTKFCLMTFDTNIYLFWVNFSFNFDIHSYALQISLQTGIQNYSLIVMVLIISHNVMRCNAYDQLILKLLSNVDS